MTFIGQALHVARKDLRESSWPITVYFALVALAAGHATGLLARASVLDSSMFFVVIAGMVLVALLVQSDSPSQPDAFWAIRPLGPAAVFTSKVAFAAIIVLGVAVVAQLLALRAFDVHGMPLMFSLGGGAISYARWLLIAMVLAALTRDLKGFIVGVVCFPLAMTLAAAIWESIPGKNGPSPIRVDSSLHLVTWVGSIASVALLFWLYRRRDRGRLALLAGAVAVGCGFVGAFDSPFGDTMTEHLGGAAPVALELTLPPGRPIDVRNIQIRVRAAVPRGQSLTLQNPSAEVELVDGKTLRLSTNPPIVDVGSARPDLGDNKWLVPNFDSAMYAVMNLQADPVEQQMLARGIKRITVTSRMLARSYKVAGALPLTAGSSLRSPGRHLTMQSVSRMAGDVDVQMLLQAIPRVHDGSSNVLTSRRPVEFALVNEARHEAMPLVVRGTSGGASWLVLPGDEVAATTYMLNTGTTTEAVHGLLGDNRWTANARLWVIDWQPVATYTVKGELTVP